MKDIKLMLYNLKYNDHIIKNKRKIIISIISVLIFVPTFIFFKPFSSLKNYIETKSQTYIQGQENNKFSLFKSKSKKKNNSTNDYVDVKNIPIAGTITSDYGMRRSPYAGMHTGIDISGVHHDNVRSIENGVVTFVGSQNGYGYCIEIKHDTYYSFYAHLSQMLVNTGDSVSKGDIIAIEGGDPSSDPNPGYSTGHHLHFEIRTNSGYGNSINPFPYLWR